ncbi:MAG: MarR family transcriptional regulator [Bacteroidetes bacterium]|jgi:DNA-binding MarR family transcriptional regulator|nr:MarR family transcriptional regulator [Bacteroidota bacterium]
MKIEEEIKQKSFHSPYQKVYVNLIFTASYMQNMHSRVMKQFGVTMQQYNVLRILRGQHPNPASVGIIQERMLDKNSNASRLIDKLLLKKFVDRKVCPDDRRQMDIKITAKGLELLKQLDVIIDGMESEMKTLTEKEALLLSDLLDKLRG